MPGVQPTIEIGVIKRQWVPLVIILGGCSRRTQWSSLLDFDYYLYYSYSGCTTASLWSHVPLEPSMVTWSSRTFYGHMILSCDLLLYVLVLFISWPHCIPWGFGLNAQMCEKPFPVWGSHNTCISMGSYCFRVYL